MPPILEVRNVAKTYGRTPVLREVNFAVEAGSYTAVVGRSGSGKSTLFRIIAALERPDTGQVVIDGTPTASMDDDALSDLRLRRIGLVFQSYNLLPELSVLENVRLPLDLTGRKRKEADARANELLGLVHMTHAAKRPPSVLSGGEAQRVAVARALANDPAILLADEPTGSLDRKNAEGILDLFDALNHTLGTTILLVTHDPIAMARAHASLEMEDGLLRPPLVRQI